MYEMSSVLIETMFLPPIPVMKTIVRHSELLIEACENYQKRSFRNRLYLSGPQGRFLYTIPLVKGKNQGKPIKEVRIAADSDWRQLLVKQIRSNYGSAPFYDHYKSVVEDMLSIKSAYLFEFNTFF